MGAVGTGLIGQKIPNLGCGSTETHVVKLEKCLIMSVKDMMGTEGHPLCRKGVVVAKAAAEADKPKGMTPKDQRNNNKIKHSPRRNQRRTASRTIIRTAISSAAKESAGSPRLRRGPRTRAAAIVSEQRCSRLGIAGVWKAFSGR